METLDNVNAQVTDAAKAHLKSAAPWMKFLGILYVIFGGLYTLLTLILLIYLFHISVLLMVGMCALMTYLGLQVLQMGNNYTKFVASNSSGDL